MNPAAASWAPAAPNTSSGVRFNIYSSAWRDAATMVWDTQPPLAPVLAPDTTNASQPLGRRKEDELLSSQPFSQHQETPDAHSHQPPILPTVFNPIQHNTNPTPTTQHFGASTSEPEAPPPTAQPPVPAKLATPSAFAISQALALAPTDDAKEEVR